MAIALSLNKVVFTIQNVPIKSQEYTAAIAGLIAFTIQNVPIKFSYLTIKSLIATTFTIQNVPIKCGSEIESYVSCRHLQYKMFLLNI